jgi:ribosomal protein S18 acetylase RimI-like enzyme
LDSVAHVSADAPLEDPQSSSSDVVVEVAVEVGDELLAAFDRLIPQLSSSSPPPSRAQLEAIVESADTVLFLARVDGRIIGSLTLAFYRIPTGLKAWIEDVVVDEAGRGKGVGRLMSEAALVEARRRGSKDVSLTSRSSREAANRLYQRIGFEARDTNLYRFKFDA